MDSITDKNSIDVVLYHGSCYDGFGSAFIVWYYYKRNFGLDKAQSISYIPCYFLKEGQQLSDDYLAKMSGKNILMCDFSFKYAELSRLINVSKSFMILDHHKSAEGDLKNIPSYQKVFDMKKSGVGITWDFMFGIQNNDPLPRFLAHIQDRDIWTNKIPKTVEFVTYFYEQQFDFELWEEFLDENRVDMAIQIGTYWLEYKDIVVDNIVKKTSYIIQEINKQYYIVLYCNSPEFKSDIGNKAFDKIPIGDFSCVWDYNLYQKQTNYSLRSTDDRMDVSLIAQKFGGGGHRNASGTMFKELTGCLPLPTVEDYGLLDLLMHNKKGIIKINNEDSPYTIFNVNEINEKWLEEKYLNLLKRKCSDSVFIVFEKPSHSVNVDTKNGIVIPQKDYLIYFNEKSSMVNPLKILHLTATGSNDFVLEFTSEKVFEELFTGLNTEEKSDQSFGSNEDSDYESNDDAEDDDQ